MSRAENERDGAMDGGHLQGPGIFTPEYYARMRDLEASGWWNAGMRGVAARLLDRARLPDRGVLLDVGCGSGQTMEWFRQQRSGWRTIGVDLALDGLTAAAELGEKVAGASALELPFPDATFDAVVTLDVLQHLPLEGGDGVALAEMRRVLRRGGHLFVRTNAQAFPTTPDDPEHDFHKYEPDELEGKLRAAGFGILRLSRVNALLGLAEIPRELRAHRTGGRRYHGILAESSPKGGLLDGLKRRWLELEGSAVARGWRLPIGRTLVALGRAEA